MAGVAEWSDTQTGEAQANFARVELPGGESRLIELARRKSCHCSFCDPSQQHLRPPRLGDILVLDHEKEAILRMQREMRREGALVGGS